MDKVNKKIFEIILKGKHVLNDVKKDFKFLSKYDWFEMLEDHPIELQDVDEGVDCKDFPKNIKEVYWYQKGSINEDDPTKNTPWYLIGKLNNDVYFLLDASADKAEGSRNALQPYAKLIMAKSLKSLILGGLFHEVRTKILGM